MITALVMSTVGTMNCYAEEPVNWNDDLKYESNTVATQSTSSTTSESANWNESGSYETQDIMWDYLMERFNNPIAAAAIMGNAGVESNYCAWRYVGDNDVDSGYSVSKAHADKMSENLEDFKYQWLIPDPPGFGLFQFATNHNMENLWNLAQEKGVPVYDVELQCEYILDRIEQRRPEVYEYLFTCDDLVDATEVFRSFGVGSTFTEKSVMHRINRAVAAYERYTEEEYAGEIHLPLFNGGSLHTLKD